LMLSALLIGAFTNPELRAWAVATITGADIVDGSIQSVDIGDKQVGNVDLATDSVDGSKIKNLSIKTGDLADGIVTSGKIKDGTIQKQDLSPNVVNPSGVTKVVFGTCTVLLSAQAHGDGFDKCAPAPGVQLSDKIIAEVSTPVKIMIQSTATGDNCAEKENDNGGLPCEEFEIEFVNLEDFELNNLPAQVEYVAFH
jgi:hypothetical protein